MSDVKIFQKIFWGCSFSPCSICHTYIHQVSLIFTLRSFCLLFHPCSSCQPNIIPLYYLFSSMLHYSTCTEDQLTGWQFHTLYTALYYTLYIAKLCSQYHPSVHTITLLFTMVSIYALSSFIKHCHIYVTTVTLLFTLSPMFTLSPLCYPCVSRLHYSLCQLDQLTGHTLYTKQYCTLVHCTVHSTV